MPWFNRQPAVPHVIPHRMHVETSEDEGKYTELKAATVRISYLERQLEFAKSVECEASKAIASIDAFRYAAEQNQERYQRSEARVKDLEMQLGRTHELRAEALATMRAVQHLVLEIERRFPLKRKRRT